MKQVSSPRLKKGYKKTEQERIPEDWEIKLLGDILKVRHGKNQSGVADDDGNVPILGTGGRIGTANKHLYNKPSVLIGRKGTIDMPQYVETPFWTIDTLFYTEVFSEVVPKYIFYMFQKIDWFSHNEASGVPSLNSRTIENIKVALPPIKEQKAIVNVLNNFDNLIQSLEKLITKKRAIKKGAMQELLTGKKRLPGFSGEWQINKLADVSFIKTGDRNNEEMIKGGQYPFFVRSQTVERLNSFSYDGEAILVPGEGGIGSIIHYVNGKFDYHQRVYKISDFHDKVLAKFLYYYTLVSRCF